METLLYQTSLLLLLAVTLRQHRLLHHVAKARRHHKALPR